MTKARSLLCLAAVALLAVLLAPADAGADAYSERARIRERQAALARDLDALQASESELTAAVAALSAQINAQEASVAAARSAVAAAEAELRAAVERVNVTRWKIAALTNVLVDKAVESFMYPSSTGEAEFLESADVAEAARKEALLGEVAARDDDIIDELGAAREDFEVLEDEATAAEARAEARREETESRLAQLEADEEELSQLRAATRARRQDVQAEASAMARAEANISRIISAAERAAADAAARRAAAAAAAARNSGGSSGGGSAPVTPSSPGPPSSGGCTWPARGTVTSEYGYRWGRLHAGIDISAPIGTPVWAAKSGTVIFAGVQSGYGNVIIVDHGGGLTTLYAHQSRFVASRGQSVSQGQTIGAVGNTGNSTGPHLHFETRYGGTPRNPRGCL